MDRLIAEHLSVLEAAKLGAGDANPDVRRSDVVFLEMEARYSIQLSRPEEYVPAGGPDFRMVHAGLPPTRGEKWIVSQFFRNRPSLGARAENVG